MIWSHACHYVFRCPYLCIYTLPSYLYLFSSLCPNFPASAPALVLLAGLVTGHTLELVLLGKKWALGSLRSLDLDSMGSVSLKTRAQMLVKTDLARDLLNEWRCRVLLHFHSHIPRNHDGPLLQG